MAGRYATDSKGNQVWVEDIKGRELDKDVLAAEKLQDVSGLAGAIKAREGKDHMADMPKQREGESMGAYAQRMREWREKNAAMKGQKKALHEMK